ncbi:hypothetical protein PGT21_026254 [Puccinia graminis f. sp. tritici]|uniref:Uncharacterized protein n=1 Tax=Puccinia graminis f. sp. tritici TaxID=56615 RepID=A0A5B0M142_PUCGR|nr:hypothetical protein PGT21_026254 [Puccinia graminis f. sp. tritici]
MTPSRPSDEALPFSTHQSHKPLNGVPRTTFLHPDPPHYALILATASYGSSQGTQIVPP